jgi:hypothetical protein
MNSRGKYPALIEFEPDVYEVIHRLRKRTGLSMKSIVAHSVLACEQVILSKYQGLKTTVDEVADGGVQSRARARS